MQVPPDVSAAHGDAVERAVAALRYGSVNINVVTMLGFCVPKLTWGAYPGNTPRVLPSPTHTSFAHLQNACHVSTPANSFLFKTFYSCSTIAL